MQSIRTTHIHVSPLPKILADILPLYLTDAIRQTGVIDIEEIRLHSTRYCSITYGGRSYHTRVILSEAEISDILKRMCAGSLYAFSQTINQGYLPLEGGLRVGVCGSAALEGEKIIGVNHVTGLIIRIPHSVHVNVSPILEHFSAMRGTRGMLIYSPPGIGKTTLLRAVAKAISSPDYDKRTVVVDTREEIGYSLGGKELNLDILIGYPRRDGIGIAVRSLGAEVIICDEIGAPGDAQAILSAANCGVPLFASAHAASVEELLSRPSIRMLHRAHVFGAYVGLRRAKDASFSYQFTDWQVACTQALAPIEERL